MATQAKAKPEARERGRPSGYSQEIADMICERLAEGDSLRAICREEGNPSMSMVFRWMVQHPDFRAQYEIAREEQAECFVDEIVGIADEEQTSVRKDGEDFVVAFDSVAVARNRLRVDARKWAASKLKSKRYGDKVTQEHTGADGGPIQHQNLDDAALEARVAALMAQVKP